MSFTSSNSSRSSSTSSSSSSTTMSSTSTYGSSKMTIGSGSNVVIRCGHIIPQIRLTPPDSRPAKCPEVPEQDLGSNSLYVPLRTEEVGWEEGGLIWAPKRFYYPTVNLYGGEDDHVIGQYRGGPKGYKFIKITDSNFSLANKDGEEDEAEQEEASRTSSTTSSSSKSKSKLPRKNIKMTTTTNATVNKPDSVTSEEAKESSRTDKVEEDESMMDLMMNKSETSSCSGSSSVTSSRQGSFSTDDGDDCSGVQTGATTPELAESPTVNEEKGTFADRLDDALCTALKEQQQEGVENGRLINTNQSKLASRTGSTKTIPNDPIDVSKLAGPLKVQLESNPLGHNRSLTLSEQKPEKHFTQQRGRSISKLSILDAVEQQQQSSQHSYVNGQEAGNQFSAGWAYEQNMLSQSNNQSSLSSSS